ncbi:vacuolar protein sorting-associated protein VTA1 homolog [Macrobrachium nipponense]|uniref:vacuolar protein sorting-associated protein VTA1 homolog n=1 Tax=Macrobrachium nipponense TaxID=159736 RepID=UPI0030C7B421
MSAVNLPPCPPQLKQVQHYLKLASDYDKREPVVSYWARLYGLQTALKIDRKSPEARALLTSLMDYLESFKREHSDNESVTSDVAGQALVENVAHKLFIWADGEDRAARFNKNVVKVFYTAGLIFDVCEVFGELTEEVAAQRKYAKWKATYIHNCLKNGETPIPGPMGGEDEGLGEDLDKEGEGAVGLGWSQPPQPHPGLPSVPNSDPAGLPSVSSSSPTHGIPLAPSGSDSRSQPQNTPAAAAFPHPPVPHSFPTPAAAPVIAPGVVPSTEGNLPKLSPDMITKAQKYCRWAVSALDYEDSKTAMSNLQKAVNLLSTGQDS